MAWAFTLILTLQLATTGGSYAQDQALCSGGVGEECLWISIVDTRTNTPITGNTTLYISHAESDAPISARFDSYLPRYSWSFGTDTYVNSVIQANKNGSGFECLSCSWGGAYGQQHYNLSPSQYTFRADHFGKDILNRWLWTDTDQLTITVIRVPQLSVSISGPSAVALGEMGTWVAGVSGGLAPHSYRWDYMITCLGLSSVVTRGSWDEPTRVADKDSVTLEPRYESPEDVNCNQWHLGSTQSSFSRATTSNVILTLKLTITDSSSPPQVKSKTMYVTIGTGGRSSKNLEQSVETVVDVQKEGDRESTQLTLEGAYPNPFNPQTVIRFSLSNAEHVRIAIYDVMGRRVASLVDSRLSAGSHEVLWQAERLSSGVYIAVLQTGSTIVTTRLTLMQ